MSTQDLFNDWEDYWLGLHNNFERLEVMAEVIKPHTDQTPVLSYNWWNALGFGARVTTAGIPKVYAECL